MSEMIERVSMAIYGATPRNKPYSLLTKFKRNALEAEARAAIEAMRGPTESMVDEATIDGCPPRIVWSIMIDAALSEKP